MPLTVTGPADSSGYSGYTAQFFVTPSDGTPPYTYQWYETTAGLLAGETQYSLSIVTVLADDGKSYYCEVSDASPTTVTSDTANLRVDAQPTTVVDDVLVLGNDGIWVSIKGNDGNAGDLIDDRAILTDKTWSSMLIDSLLGMKLDRADYDPQKMKFVFEGYVSGNEYQRNDVVFENGWTMIANTVTQAYPAPSPTGLPSWLSGQGDTPAWGTLVSGASTQIIYGQRYTAPIAVYGTQVRVWIDELTKFYSVNVIINSTTTPQIRQLIPEAQFPATGWYNLPIPRVILPQGTTYDLVVYKTDRTTATPFTYVYNYDTPPNNGAPPTGTILHANATTDLLNVHYFDDGGVDRGATLAQIAPGDTIEGAGILWTVLSASDQTTYYTFEVAPAIQGTDGTGDFTFITHTAQPQNYVNIADQFLGNANIAGFYSETGLVNAVFDDDMYGVDLEVQEIYLSDDWNVVAPGE